MMKPVGEITMRETVEGATVWRDVMQDIVSAIAGVRFSTPDLADHFLRRILTDGWNWMYDPGDEPAADIDRVFQGRAEVRHD